MKSIAVVGGSLAGLRGAEALRRLGFDGRLAWVGAERELPYDRPPLSKEVLAGKREPDRIGLCKPEAFEALELELHLGRRAVDLDLAGRQLELDDGGRVDFEGLLIATGASPRRLPDTPALAGIHMLRSLEDCLAIRAELDRSPRVAIVGAGFIGAEVAATCRERGLDVSLIETLKTPLAAVVSAEIGSVCAALQRDHGVDLRCETRVAGFEGGERVETVRLADGSRVAADVVVVGVGVTPETDWLASSGLALDDGVVCDETTAASAPGVVAAGDVARWHNPLFDVSMRVEHWTNAVEQAEAAAARLLSGPSGASAYAPVPFVWSDQYDRKIQCAGLIAPGDSMRVVDGSLEERRFVAIFGRGERLIGALAFNRPRLLMGYRRKIAERMGWRDALGAAESA